MEGPDFPRVGHILGEEMGWRNATLGECGISPAKTVEMTFGVVNGTGRRVLDGRAHRCRHLEKTVE